MGFSKLGLSNAMLEGVNALVTLCKDFHFVKDDDKLPLNAQVTLNPKQPVMVKVKKI